MDVTLGIIFFSVSLPKSRSSIFYSHDSINTRPEVRLVLFLNQIFNYMWIEAMFVNRTETTEDCFAGAICLDTSWIVRRLSAVIFGFLLGTPAMRIMYVLPSVKL